MATEEPPWVGAAVEQYARLPPWERRLNVRMCRRFYDQGLKAQDPPEVTRQLAVYLGWRGSMLLWALTSVVAGVLLDAASSVDGGVLPVILAAAGVLVWANAGFMAYFRLRQARQRNPHWRDVARLSSRTIW